MRPTISILRVNHFFRNEALGLAKFPLHYTGFHLWRYFDYGNSFVAYPQPGSGIPDSRIIAAIIPQWILEVGEWEIPAMIPSHANLHVLYVSPTFKAKAILRLAQFCLRGAEIELFDFTVLRRSPKFKLWYVAREGPFFNGEEGVVKNLRDELGKLESLHGSQLLSNVIPGRGSRTPVRGEENWMDHAKRYCHNFVRRHL